MRIGLLAKTRSRRTAYACLSCVAAHAVAITGCSDGRPERVPVAGTVLIDGRPLQYAYIRFVPTGARASGGQVDSQGRFTLGCFTPDDGAVIGTHRVEVNAGERIGEVKVHWHAPKKYADYHSSGIEQSITQATDSLVISLSWDGGKPFMELIDGGEQQPSRAPRPEIPANSN